MAYTQAKHIQNITVRNQFRISERVNLERGVTSYFPGDRDKESTHSPFSPCTNRVGCVRCWGNFAETNRLALNGLKLWSPLTRVSSVVLEAEGFSPCTVRCCNCACANKLTTPTYANGVSFRSVQVCESSNREGRRSQC